MSSTLTVAPSGPVASGETVMSVGSEGCPTGPDDGSGDVADGACDGFGFDEQPSEAASRTTAKEADTNLNDLVMNGPPRSSVSVPSGGLEEYGPDRPERKIPPTRWHAGAVDTRRAAAILV